MDFRVLGPLEVIDDAGAALPLGACRQRAVLAVLVRRAARVTPVADLIDAVYGLEPPPSASNAVQVYVSSLRKLLGPDRVAHPPRLHAGRGAGRDRPWPVRPTGRRGPGGPGTW